ncbi:MAG: AAA domain-containing protein [Hyphomonadaceae bacterium]
MTQAAAAALADAMVRDVLSTQWDGVSALVLNSPPGAGKTGVAERLSVQGLALMKERVMVATPTNEQAFDLARRLGLGFPRLTFFMMTSRSLEIPPDILALANVQIVHASADLPDGPCVAIGNGAKWSWLDADDCQFDLQIVDEAYQLPDYRFHLIAGLARRHVLIGDPGQIDPVIQAELERWRCDVSGPHVPAPRALIARHSGVRQLSLPVSRRLVSDTASFVQPAFYPDLPFVALHDARPVRFATPGIAPMDIPLDAVVAGESLVMVELPALLAGDVDHDLADELVWTINRVLTRGATIEDESGVRPITPAMIGVACARVAQVNAIRERLGAGLSDVFVETANRFQGLERQLMFVQHPLSGRADATDFHLDSGRLCVLLSRHRAACWIFGRDGISRQLRRYAPVGDRSLGISDDPEFEGWRANMELMRTLEQRGRIYRVPGGSGRRTA